MPNLSLTSLHRAAFTLVELAIVLVIIGLIVGGILVGVDLVKQSEMRAQIKQLDALTAAVQSFRLKYNALPGDMTNATSLWGVDPAGCPTSPYTASSHPETCNGNGDGAIYTNYEQETHRFWQHLANAGLIEGQYTGTCAYVGANCSSNASSWTAGVNTPTAAIRGGTIHMVNVETRLPAASYPGWFWQTRTMGNSFWLGSSPTVSWPGGILTPNEARNLDEKIDDGLPASGRVETNLIYSYGATGCQTTNVASTAVYGQSNSTVGCAPFISGGF